MIIDVEHHLSLDDFLENVPTPSGRICERFWDRDGKLKIRIYQEASDVERGYRCNARG